MLSFGKILLLVIVVVIAVLGFRLVSIMTRNANAAARQPAAPTASQPRAEPRAAKSADLTACPTCGAYSDGRCDRPDCGLAR
jgi:hypothetical protein